MVLNFCTESTWDMGAHACLFTTTAPRAVMVLISMLYLCVLTGIFTGQFYEPNDRICNSKTRLLDLGIAPFIPAVFPLHP
jgi:hypothetical protein